MKNILDAISLGSLLSSIIVEIVLFFWRLTSLIGKELSDNISRNIFKQGLKYFSSVSDLNEIVDLSLFTEVLKTEPVDSNIDAISSDFFYIYAI